MVTPTNNPLVVRISIPAAYRDESIRADIVCLVEAGEKGLQIHYQYHQMYRRAAVNSPGRKGPEYVLAEKSKLTLNNDLRTEILIGCRREWWEYFCQDIRLDDGGTS